MLALAQESGTGQNDSEHGDIINQLGESPEPRLLQIGIEAGPEGQINRWWRGITVSLQEAVDLVQDDLLDVTAAAEGLCHPCRIDIQLNG